MAVTSHHREGTTVEERIALVVFVAMAGLMVAGWRGRLPKGLRDLLGEEEEGRKPWW